MHRETLVTPARAARAEAAARAGLALLARALVSFNVPPIVTRVVDGAIFRFLGRMHLSKMFVTVVSMATDADVVILIEYAFATITMHVDIR